MEISVLNKDFVKIAIVDTYSSLICCKRYYDAGGLDLQIEATTETLSVFKNGYYITRNDDETVYRIEAIELDTKENHDNSLIIGAVDCKELLKQRIIWETISFKGTVENYIRKLITDNVISPTVADRQISNFLLKPVKGFPETINQQVSYENLLEKIEDICKTYNLGWSISFENGNFYFDLYKGVNRSKNQTENNPVIFSPEYDNLASSKYNFDSQNYKNVALVGGEGEGKDRKKVSVGSAVGLERFEMFVDSSSSSTNTDEEITETEYLNQLRSQGVDELTKQSTVTSFEGEIVADSYIYKKDYNLGDIVTITNEYGITVDARIVEIVETWDSNGYSLEPKFEYMEVQEIVSTEEALLTESAVPLMLENGIMLMSELSTSGNGIKISELAETTEVGSGCCMPIVQGGETKKIYFDNFANNVLPIGTILSGLYSVAPEGFLLCNGQEVLKIDYPELYNVIGSLDCCKSEDETKFKIPDFRECALVGIGQNDTDTIENHDVYTLGEFKDDQLQDHKHKSYRHDSLVDFGRDMAGSEDWADDWGSRTRDNESDVPFTGRHGEVTRGKRKGVNYIIKAT